MYKVIVVDDEQMERMAVTHILNNSGLPVTITGEASDGLEAVALFADVRPDIVLIDIKMPCKSGLEAASEMLASGTDAVTIFLTAYDEFEYAQKAIRLGALDYILKPVRPEDVVTTVYRAIKELENRRHQKIRCGERRVHGDPAAVRSSLVFNLANSNFSLEDLRNLADFLELENSWQTVLVIRMGTGDGDRDNSFLRGDQAKQKVLSIINEESHLFGTVLMTSMETGEIVALVSVKEGQDDDGIGRMLCAWADGVLEKFAKAGPGSIEIGVGKPFREPDRIHESYFQARRVFKTEAPRVEPVRLPRGDAEEKYYASSCYVKERTLHAHIADGEWDRVPDSFKEWFIEIAKSGEPLYAKKARVAQMVIVPARAALERGADRERVFGRVVEFHNRLNLGDCLMDVIDHALLMVREFGDLICDGCKSYSARIIEKATEYIRENYCRNIRMDEVARAVSLSPPYFSRLFKKEMDATFLDYLTQLRLDKAKQLLRDQSITIGEVARAVGYGEACYFSRVFKKHERLSPREYRCKINK
jgi:two-component system response regulator YesN